MNLENMVFVMSSSGEQLLGERTTSRKEFDSDAGRGVAVVLDNVRRFEARQFASGGPNELGKTKVHIVFDLVPLEPFPYPVKIHVRLTRWMHLSDTDDNQLRTILQKMTSIAEDREKALRASAAGIHLPHAPLSAL
jgi:hypothetical protein